MNKTESAELARLAAILEAHQNSEERARENLHRDVQEIKGSISQLDERTRILETVSEGRGMVFRILLRISVALLGGSATVWILKRLIEGAGQ